MANFPPTPPLLLLLLLFLALINAIYDTRASAAFLNINCGASRYDKSLLSWSDDELYVEGGESHVVQASSSVSKEMTSLRAFPAGKKNCYSLSVDKGDRVLVRASFFYGNYDSKSNPPTFDLHFDGNYWATVVTSSEQVINYEVVYVVKGDVLSVCVAQTQPDQIPFISAIQVRSLDPGMYSHVDPNYPLFLRKRIAYGTNQTVRSPYDFYDRTWETAVLTQLNKIQSDIFMTVDVEDDPPRKVLTSAATPMNLSYSMVLRNYLPTFQVPIYVNMYFSEVLELNATDKRSFDILVGGSTVKGSISPPYESTLEVQITNMTASSNNSISLVAKSDSTLPPLINAMEVFIIGEALTNGTNPKDMEALSLLQSTFSFELKALRGDPCLPAPYTWDRVTCNSEASPRITSIDLSGLGLVGPLPDFSGMDALEIINCQNNSLGGDVPDFFASFPNLKELNLADNQFDGTVPSSISQNKNLKLDISGNQDLCLSGKSCDSSSNPSFPRLRSGDDYNDPDATYLKNKKSIKVARIIIGATLPTYALIAGIVGIVAILLHRRRVRIATTSAGQIGASPKASGTATSNGAHTGYERQMESENRDLYTPTSA